MIVPKVRDITGPFDQRNDQKCEVTREHCLTTSKVALKDFTMRGETSIAATTLVALFSTRPSAARQLQDRNFHEIDTLLLIHYLFTAKY